MKRRSILCALAVTAMAACISGTAVQAEETKDSITVSINSEPTALLPLTSPTNMTGYICRQIYDTLLTADNTGKEVSEGLATEWEVNEDSSEVLFTLRDDVYFHNGEKMTADDVVFSYNENIELGICETETSYYDRMEKVDDTHVKLILKQPYSSILVAVASIDCPIICQSAYEADPDGYARNPIGTGPYKFVEWKSGEYITITRNDDYWGEKAAIKDVTFKIFLDDSAAALALENGEIDVDITPPTAEKDRIETTDGLTWEGVTGYNNAWIFFNVGEDSPFADKNVRLAVAYAIDKESACIGATDDLGTVAHGSVYGDWQGYTSEGYEAPQNDLELAKEYMAKSDYPDGFDCEVTTINTERYYKIWEVVQPMLAEIGINVTINQVDQGTWNNDVYWTGDYTINGWQASQSFADFDDHRVCWRSGAFLNTGNLNDEHLDELLDAQDLAETEEERVSIIQEAMEYMGDEAYVVPLYNFPNFVAYNSDLQGITAAPQQGNYRISTWSWAE